MTRAVVAGFARTPHYWVSTTTAPTRTASNQLFPIKTAPLPSPFCLSTCRLGGVGLKTNEQVVKGLSWRLLTVRIDLILNAYKLRNPKRNADLDVQNSNP